MQQHATAYPMRLTVAEVSRLVDEHFPQVHEGPGRVAIEELDIGRAQVRMLADPATLRPGGTVSGPTMFKLADFTIYAALLGHLGDYALQAVTTSLTINFLSRPAPADLVAQARLIKVGRRLAISDVEIYAEGSPDMVAHATGTYALPPASGVRQHPTSQR
jgi:uncharacterized protein (TIGR00369 family)